MNAKQKVVDALVHMHGRRVELDKAENLVLELRNQAQAAEQELVRVLRSVYGERARAGVVFKGDRYSVDLEANSLVESPMDAEVLG